MSILSISNVCVASAGLHATIPWSILFFLSLQMSQDAGQFTPVELHCLPANSEREKNKEPWIKNKGDKSYKSIVKQKPGYTLVAGYFIRKQFLRVVAWI